jgi:hypothetical protein
MRGHCSREGVQHRGEEKISRDEKVFWKRASSSRQLERERMGKGKRQEREKGFFRTRNPSQEEQGKRSGQEMGEHEVGWLMDEHQRGGELERRCICEGRGVVASSCPFEWEEQRREKKCSVFQNCQHRIARKSRIESEARSGGQY